MFDFDKIIPRKGSGCVKWDAKPPVEVDGDIIPLWVADMDFPAAPCIQKALEERVAHGVFGYTIVQQGWYDSVCNWFKTRHGWALEPSQLLYTTGVVPGIAAVLKALTHPGEKVVILSPVYNCFFSCVRNVGCIVSDSPLKVVDGPRYEIDFEDLERRCSDPSAKVLLFCNPHNPAGRVWTRKELETVADIARRHGLTIVSDEIHCEITAPGVSYIPMATVTPCVALGSPSKAFNIAGLQMAFIATEDAAKRSAIDEAINMLEINMVNPFGPVAAQAAYSPEGAAWLDAVNAYIWDNYLLLRDTLGGEFPVFELEGTYLAWIDCRSFDMPSARLEEELLRRERVWVNAASMYGGEGYLRVNLAIPRPLLAEGLARLLRGLRSLKNAP